MSTYPIEVAPYGQHHRANHYRARNWEPREVGS